MFVAVAMLIITVLIMHTMLAAAMPSSYFGSLSN